MNHERVPFTGIVVVCNEDERLRECLESLHFCDEILVVDLESDDQSVEIAQNCGARVLHHERIPTAGAARKHGAKNAENDWIVFLDPDEVFPSALYPEMCRLVNQNPKLGRIFVPWRFYFQEEPLHGTKWGGKKQKGHVVNRERCFIGPPEHKYAHQEVSLRDGFESEHLSWEHGEYIEHYWMDSYTSLIEKHLRYVENEGMVRYERGERFPGWGAWLKRVVNAFRQSFVNQNGWREGTRGLFLSLFWAWYKGASLVSLSRYQKERGGHA
mgnify:CR=1 FL=1